VDKSVGDNMNLTVNRNDQVVDLNAILQARLSTSNQLQGLPSEQLIPQ
jgi:hypothetical protein